MTIDDRTLNFSLPLPHVSNIDTVDVTRLRSALAILDTEVAARLTTPQVNALLGVYASQAYVNSQIAALVNSAPGVLDTLAEIAAALGNDASFAATMASQLASLNSAIGANTTAIGTKQDALTLASQAEMEAGSVTALRGMTPQRVAQAIAALGKAKVTLSDRTSNTMLGAADHARYVRVTSGTFTQTFDTAATLGSGWYCWIENDGTGDVTLDPNASETIDGLTSFVMYPNEARLIFCTGTAFESVVMRSYAKAFIASGTFTKPPGYRMHDVWMWGGGGAGGRTGNTGRAQGGVGSGAYHMQLPASIVGATETIVVGAGGTGRTTTGNGNNGGISSFGAYQSHIGIGGLGDATTTYSGQSSTDSNLKVEEYKTGYASANTMNLFYEAGRGGSAIGGSLTLYSEGTSVVGGSGGAPSNTTTGDAANGSAPGGGGGGKGTGAGTPSSGSGARGEIRVSGVI